MEQSMCLNSRLDFHVSTNIGYKYFRPNLELYEDYNNKNDESLLPQFNGREFEEQVTNNNNGPYKLKEWITDTSNGVLPFSCSFLSLPNNNFLVEPTEQYKSGFHIYVYAPTYNIVKSVRLRDGFGTLYKVEYKNVVAKGLKGNQYVVVARDMRILYKM
jgi:hypothetical protein